MKDRAAASPGAAWRRLWPLAASVFLLSACAYELLSGSQVNQQNAAKIEAGIQRLRQLSFKRKVPLVVKTPAEVEKLLIADMARDTTDTEFQVDGAAGALLGLYPVGIDLKAATLKLLRSQVAGFYDPHQKQMVLVEGGSNPGFWNGATEFLVQRDVVGEMLLAHELTHALQDQNFALEQSLDKVKDDDDKALALKCVAEGDATLAGFAYAMGSMSDATADTLTDHLRDLPQEFAAESGDTPEGLSAPLLFQYSDGVRFVAEAYRRGGWAAVDALYRNPPQSSHQIIHPALYFDRPTPPLKISIDGYQTVMSRWTKADDDTYGELLLRTILERNLGDESYDVDLARLWSGDHMVILQEGRGLTVIWMLAFEDQPTASHFAAVYATLLDRLLDGVTEHRIDYRGKAVLVLIGEGAQYFNSLAPAIWNASRIDSHRAGGVLESADAQSP
ncbi:MAG TPA: hypothetical protein VIX59_03340 [Candidatus Binataceae bacterium]